MQFKIFETLVKVFREYKIEEKGEPEMISPEEFENQPIFLCNRPGEEGILVGWTIKLVRADKFSEKFSAVQEDGSADESFVKEQRGWWYRFKVCVNEQVYEKNDKTNIPADMVEKINDYHLPAIYPVAKEDFDKAQKISRFVILRYMGSHYFCANEEER